MESFGDKLRQALESRGLGPEEAAAATGLEVSQLEALQRNDFSALPHDETVQEALQSFARLVDVNPDEVLADYRRERRQQPAPASQPVRGPGRAAGLILAALAVLALAAAALVWLRSTSAPQAGSQFSQPASATESGGAPSMAEVAVENPAPLDAPGRPALPVPDTDDRAPAPATTTPQEPPPQPEPATVPAVGLTITAHGVGTGVVNHELVGEAGQFAEGSEVWFWTRVEGGAAGETIHHVWLRNGHEMLAMPLRIGGPRWRTQSAKFLHPGSAGGWAVEARDAAGRVLARSAFRCSP